MGRHGRTTFIAAFIGQGRAIAACQHRRQDRQGLAAGRKGNTQHRAHGNADEQHGPTIQQYVQLAPAQEPVPPFSLGSYGGGRGVNGFAVSCRADKGTARGDEALLARGAQAVDSLCVL
jgi:hypothetical protein